MDGILELSLSKQDRPYLAELTSLHVAYYGDCNSLEKLARFARTRKLHHDLGTGSRMLNRVVVCSIAELSCKENAQLYEVEQDVQNVEVKYDSDGCVSLFCYSRFYWTYYANLIMSYSSALVANSDDLRASNGDASHSTTLFRETSTCTTSASKRPQNTM